MDSVNSPPSFWTWSAMTGQGCSIDTLKIHAVRVRLERLCNSTLKPKYLLPALYACE